MKNLKINFIVDIALSLMFSAVIGTGLLIKYVLLSGRDVWSVYGRKDIQLEYWGLTRHEWGELHLILGLLFLCLLVVHLLLHKKLIQSMLEKFIALSFGTKMLGIGILTICILVMLGPLMVKPDISPKDRVSPKAGFKHHSLHQKVRRSKLFQ